jgi:hypothetical protein
MGDYEVISALDSSGPFGDSDASRVNFQTLKASFINLSSTKVKVDESLGADVSVRVIVGRRGAGKTLYLRSIQDYCKRLSGNVYVTEIDNQPPDTSLIVKVTAWCDDNDNLADQVWRRIWMMVILRTVYSHLFGSPALSKYFKGRKSHFVNNYKRILPTTRMPVSVFAQMTSLLSKFNSLKDLQDFLHLDEWADFEYDLGNILIKSPPMYFFIDQLDDDFASAPYHWLKCQYGLFASVFRLIKNEILGGKLHIVVCIREVVYTYILQTQQGNKYLAERKIKVLKWDQRLSEHFLNKKIENLDDKYFTNSRSKNAETFFGVPKVKLKRHGGLEEEIRSYITRHTRLLPRDIINIGNMFCEDRDNHESMEHFETAIKSTVSKVAKQIAKDQLKMASIFICNKWIYNGAVEDENYAYYTNENMLIPINENLRKLILYIGKDRFSQKTFSKAKNKIKSFGFLDGDDPFAALFYAGLLGYVELEADGNERAVFFSESRNVQFNLPFHSKEYVFHSSLIDLLGIEPIGAPVYA